MMEARAAVVVPFGPVEHRMAALARSLEGLDLGTRTGRGLAVLRLRSVKSDDELLAHIGLYTLEGAIRMMVDPPSEARIEAILTAVESYADVLGFDKKYVRL